MEPSAPAILSTIASAVAGALSGHRVDAALARFGAGTFPCDLFAWLGLLGGALMALL